MPNKTPPRERLLEATAELLQQNGYYGTGLKDILALSQVPRGSLYHYYPAGKDELVSQALHVAGEVVLKNISQELSNSKSLTEAIKGIFDIFRRAFHESNFQKGCPLATVVLEISAQNEEIFNTTSAVYNSWEEAVRNMLETSGMAPEIARENARIFLIQIEGGLLLSRAHRTTDYLDQALKTVLKLFELE